ncbi:MAG: hypothetical protein V3S55_15600 [Nitrospiraceae bacterium]
MTQDTNQFGDEEVVENAPEADAREKQLEDMVDGATTAETPETAETVDQKTTDEQPNEPTNLGESVDHDVAEADEGNIDEEAALDASEVAAIVEQEDFDPTVVDDDETIADEDEDNGLPVMQFNEDVMELRGLFNTFRIGKKWEVLEQDKPIELLGSDLQVREALVMSVHVGTLEDMLHMHVGLNSGPDSSTPSTRRQELTYILEDVYKQKLTGNESCTVIYLYPAPVVAD